MINGRAVPMLLVAALAAALSSTRAAQAQVPASPADADSAAVVGVVERFHEAVAAGDSASAAALLDAQAVIVESGDVETRTEYLRGHLAADIAFARAVRSARTVVHLTHRADAAWVTSTSRATGTFETRPVDSEGAELMVLTRSPRGWRIAAIHWSSHRHRP